MNALIEHILAFALGVGVAVILVTFIKFIIWLKDKYVKHKIYSKSDKRTFDCSEVVWFNGNKFFITHWQWWSHTLDIDLTLRPIKYNLSFLEAKVDSREVKKVVRMYAELGRKFDEN